MARRFDGKPEPAVRQGSPFDHNSGQPPHAESCLAHHVHRIRAGLEGRGRAWPSEIPPDPMGAARWWMRQQEPIKPGERPRMIACPHVGGGQRWELPYLARLVGTLQIYVCLEAKAREVILAALFDGVYWRGEEVLNDDGGPGPFLRVYDETLRAREIPLADYVPEACKRMRLVIDGMRMR